MMPIGHRRPRVPEQGTLGSLGARGVAAPLPISAGGGTQPLLQMRAATAVAEDLAQVHAIAARGTTTPATRLPYADQIQRAFCQHDISGIQAHTGQDAAASAREMGARAYAT